MVTMSFTLDEEWKGDEPSFGEALFWTSPGRAPDMAAHVYECLGTWEWYVFEPCGSGAFTGGKADKPEDAKTQALAALRGLDVAPSLPPPGTVEHVAVPSTAALESAEEIAGRFGYGANGAGAIRADRARTLSRLKAIRESPDPTQGVRDFIAAMEGRRPTPMLPPPPEKP